MKHFRGGVVLSHTQAMKEAAAQGELRRLSPDTLYVSLRVQGRLLTPCVSLGETVRVGQALAVDDEKRIPPLHSGVSGEVTAVGAFHPAADGGEAPTLIIKNDKKNTAGVLLSPLDETASPEEIVQRMYDAGLVGMGGGGYPTHLKYRDLKAEWLLINGCECEPYLAADACLSQQFFSLIAEGTRLLARAAGVSEEHVRLCAESSAAVEALRNTDLPVVQLPKRYPQGSERQLIEAVLNRRLDDGVLPTQAGIAVSNIATAAAMGDAARGLPLTHRILTVSGQVKTPLNLLLPIGTPFADAARLSAPDVSGRVRYIAGGPMTGRRLTSLKAGIPKTCGGLMILPSRSAPETPCIRCGACVRACPSSLMPFLIESLAMAGDVERCAELRATACLSCGCCSYVCPAKRQLAARITAVKREIKERSV